MPESSRTRRTVSFERPKEVVVRSEPFTVSDEEVYLESELIGISHGTEMLFYNGPFPSGQTLEAIPEVGTSTGYPIAYGYMNVARSKEGRFFAFAPHHDRFAAKPDALMKIPDGVDSRDAVLFPSVETALQIVHDTHPALAVPELGVQAPRPG